MEEVFDVWQFFPDDTYERMRSRLTAKEAVEEAKRLTETLGGRLGTTRRVIITDDGDNTVFEWRFGEGVTYPTPEMRKAG